MNKSAALFGSLCFSPLFPCADPCQTSELVTSTAPSSSPSQKGNANDKGAFNAQAFGNAEAASGGSGGGGGGGGGDDDDDVTTTAEGACSPQLDPPPPLLPPPSPPPPTSPAMAASHGGSLAALVLVLVLVLLLVLLLLLLLLPPPGPPPSPRAAAADPAAEAAAAPSTSLRGRVSMRSGSGRSMDRATYVGDDNNNNKGRVVGVGRRVGSYKHPVVVLA